MSAAVSMESRVAALVNDFTPDRAEFERKALHHLSQFFGCDSSWFATFGPDFTEGLPDYFKKIIADPQRFDPDQERSKKIRNQFGTAFIDTVAYTAEERDSLPIFRELMQPAGISSVLVSHVEVANEATGIINLVRCGRPFTLAQIDEGRPLLRTAAIMHRAIVGGPITPPDEVLSRLSPRELEVAALAGEGYGSVQIAARLGTSPHTVRRQLESIYRKCSISSRAELVTLVQRSQARRPGPRSKFSGNLLRILESVNLQPSVRTEDWQRLG